MVAFLHHGLKGLELLWGKTRLLQQNGNELRSNRRERNRDSAGVGGRSRCPRQPLNITFMEQVREVVTGRWECSVLLVNYMM